MCRVSTMQLLRRLSGQGLSDLDVVDNPQHQRPTEFERPGQVVVPRFGTDDLIELADAMAEQGYRATHLDLRDHRFNVLPEGEEEFAEERLLRDLRNRDVDGARYFLSVEARDVFVIAIEFSAPSGFRFRLNRDGIVTTNHETEELRGDLANGWRRVITP
jgi:hypothetical protein